MAGKHGGKLASDVIKTHFGELSEKVYACLIKRGPLSRAEIARFTEMNTRQLKDCLLVLVQHNCVQHCKVEHEGDGQTGLKFRTSYVALVDKVLPRMRFPEFLAVVRDELGGEAESLLEGLLEHGKLTLEQVIQRAASLQGKGESDVESLQKGTFAALVRARNIERCPACKPTLASKSSEPVKKMMQGEKKSKSIMAGVKQAEGEKDRIMAAVACQDTERFRLPNSVEGLRETAAGETMTDSVKSGQKRKRKALAVDDKMVAFIDEREVSWRANYEELIKKADQRGGTQGDSSRNLDVVVPSSKKKKNAKRGDGQNVDQDAILNGRINEQNAVQDVVDATVGKEDAPVKSSEPALLSSIQKKTVRFQLPDLDVPEELTANSPQTAYVFDDEVRNWKRDFQRQDLVYGRYSKEEDEKIIKSVHSYIKMKGWDLDEGLRTVLNSSQHSEARGCWIDIAKCLPHRAVKQINSRAKCLLAGDKRGRWSPEEITMLEKLFKLHRTDWKQISQAFERSGQLLKDKWRKLKFRSGRKGIWTQDELDKLCQLVRRDFVISDKLGGRPSGRRVVRDNINWEVIAEKMQRNSAICSSTWYGRLASPMVVSEQWSNEDDRLLLQRLLEMGASSEEAVDWDDVLDHRDGALCMERWREMTRLLDRNTHVSFEDKLEILAKRYSPDLLGITEEMPV